MPNTIKNINSLDFSKRYTYADYLNWHFKERVELIKGWIHKMSPAPRRYHQKVSFNLTLELGNWFDNNECEMYTAPFDVRLQKNKGDSDDNIETVVQPDLSVICDKSKLDDRGCLGAPDLIVEILSPSTAKKDFNDKYYLYQENGVKEYWIVNPDGKSVNIFVLVNNIYQEHSYFEDAKGIIKSPTFSELEIECQVIFKD